MSHYDKGELMVKVLDRYQAGYRPWQHGWQKIRCINPVGHSHGDRTPSATVNVVEGAYVCFACGLKGDAYSLLEELEGITFKQALEVLEVDGQKPAEEETWLTWR